MTLYNKDVIKDQFKNKSKSRIIIYCCIAIFTVFAIGYTWVDYKENNLFKFHPVLFIGLIHCIFLIMLINGKWYYRNNITISDNGVLFSQNNIYKPTSLIWNNIIKVSVTHTSVKFYTNNKNYLYHFHQFSIDDVRAIKLCLQKISMQKNIAFASK